MGCRLSSSSRGPPPPLPPAERAPPLRQLHAFVPAVDAAKVVKVYDGDTITVGAPLAMNGTTQYYKFRVRLRGIDCPELRTRDFDEKRQAEDARDMLKDRILEEVVHLHDVSVDKYGRLLATVLHRGEDVSAWMLARGAAVPYDGTGEKWRDRAR